MEYVINLHISIINICSMYSWHDVRVLHMFDQRLICELLIMNNVIELILSMFVFAREIPEHNEYLHYNTFLPSSVQAPALARLS